MKVNKYFKIISLLLGVIFLVVCGKKDSPTSPGPVEKNYIPYEVGNSWTYQVTPITGDPPESPYTSTLEVISKVTIGGVELAVVKEQSTKAPDDFSLIYYQSTDNSLLMQIVEDFVSATSDTTSFKFDPPATWLKLPFVKDDTWQVFTYQGDPSEIPLVGSGFDDPTYAGLQVDLTLSGKTMGEETVNAAGQDFKAFKVDFDYIAKITISGIPIQLPGKLGSFWIVPEVGIVRISFYDLDGNISELRTMTDYDVN